MFTYPLAYAARTHADEGAVHFASNTVFISASAASRLCRSCAVRSERAQRGCGSPHLLRAHFWQHPQGQDARLMRIGYRKVRGSVAEAAVSGQEGKRGRVVDGRLNAALRKMTGELVPSLVLHDVKVIHVL